MVEEKQAEPGDMLAPPMKAAPRRPSMLGDDAHEHDAKMRKSMVALAQQDPDAEETDLDPNRFAARDGTDLGWDAASGGQRSGRSGSIASPQLRGPGDGAGGLHPVREESKPNLFPDSDTNKDSAREFELKYINSDDDMNDPLNRALHNVREIPLESYLTDEKAMKVKEARRKRLKYAKKSDKASDSHDADSSYIKTGYSSYDEVARRKHRNAQYKDVKHFPGLDAYLVRRHEKMTKLEKMTIEDCCNEHKERREKRNKKIERNESLGSLANISNFSEFPPVVEPVTER